MFIPGKPVVKFKDIKKLFYVKKKVYFLNLQNSLFFSKGRDALWAGLQFLPSKKIGKVWLPAYICRSVVDVIMFTMI